MKRVVRGFESSEFSSSESDGEEIYLEDLDQIAQEK